MPCYALSYSLLKRALPSGQAEEEAADDVEADHHHQWVHHPVIPAIAYSAHGHPGAAVLIPAVVVVLARERDINIAQRTVVDVAIIYLRLRNVTEKSARITKAVLVHIVQGVLVGQDIVELVADAVSFK